MYRVKRTFLLDLFSDGFKSLSDLAIFQHHLVAENELTCILMIFRRMPIYDCISVVYHVTIVASGHGLLKKCYPAVLDCVLRIAGSSFPLLTS